MNQPRKEGSCYVSRAAGLVTEGDTLAEARDMAADAIRGYLESLRKDGLQVPADKTIPARPRKEHICVALDAASLLTD